MANRNQTERIEQEEPTGCSAFGVALVFFIMLVAAVILALIIASRAGITSMAPNDLVMSLEMIL